MTPIAKSPLIQQARTTLREVLNDDPISIIEQYFLYSDATEVLTLGSDGKPVDSETNRIIIDSIKLAFSSGDCDRAIIRLIFQKAILNGYTQTLNLAINELHRAGKPINLNNTNFSGLDISNLDFSHVSIRQCNFTGTKMHDVRFVAADITGSFGMSQSLMSKLWIDSATVILDTEFDSEALQFVLLHSPGKPVRII